MMSVLKFCPHCSSMKPAKKFATKLQCKECRDKQRTARRVENKKVVFDILAKNSCEDCGESNPFVLDFDHWNPEDKHKSVSKMLHQGSSLERILEEISKCVVRCANCHRIKTMLEGDHYAYVDDEYKSEQVRDYLKRMLQRRTKSDAQ